MLSTLISLVLAAAVAAFWYAGRGAAEAATAHGRRACERASVQWLDQSVHLVAMRLRRGPDGWLGVERKFRFEYSTDGDDRRAGLLVLHGTRLTALAGPMPPAT